MIKHKFEITYQDSALSSNAMLDLSIVNLTIFSGGLVFISQENEVIEVSIEHRICEKELKSCHFL